MSLAVRPAVAFAASLALAAAARAQAPQLLTTLSPQIGETEHTQTLKVHGTPGDRAWVLVSEHPGELELSGIGTLRVGLGAGLLVLPLGSIPASGVLEASNRPGCDSPLTSAPRFLQVFTLGAVDAQVSGLGLQHVLNTASGDCGRSVQAAQPALLPDFGGAPQAVALELPGIGDDFAFVAGGTLVERATGYAHLAGVVARASAPQQRFLVELDLAQAVRPGDLDYPPAGSPRIELAPHEYVEQGGAIDPATWHYYEQVDGRLLGLGALDGALLSVRRSGTALQLGRGANGRNGALGAAGELDVQVLAPPTSGAAFAPSGAAVLRLDVGVDASDRATKAAPQSRWSASQYTHAFYLPEIGKDFAFDPPGLYVEQADGTARLTGTIRRASQRSKAFTVDVTFSQRVNPGAAVFPPPGSPKKSLLPRAYVENGGSVDPTAWHYFQHIEGRLTGIDDYSGGVLRVTRDGPAFQVGYGANDKNLGWGASGWLTVAILSHPTFSAPFPSALDSGDVNVDLGD